MAYRKDKTDIKYFKKSKSNYALKAKNARKCSKKYNFLVFISLTISFKFNLKNLPFYIRLNSKNILYYAIDFVT